MMATLVEVVRPSLIRRSSLSRCVSSSSSLWQNSFPDQSSKPRKTFKRPLSSACLQKSLHYTTASNRSNRPEGWVCFQSTRNLGSGPKFSNSNYNNQTHSFPASLTQNLLATKGDDEEIVQSTKVLNEALRNWKRKNKNKLTAQHFEELLTWLLHQYEGEHTNHNCHITGRPDSETFGMLLEWALKCKDDAATNFILGALLEHLLETVAFGIHTFGGPTIYSLPPRPIEWYLEKVIKRYAFQKPPKTNMAQECLERWWVYHEQSPERIPLPSSRIYATIMSGWDKQREPGQALSLLQEMQGRKQVQAQVMHYETCLNAFVRAVVSPKSPKNGLVGYKAESVLLQMTAWLDEQGSGLVPTTNNDMPDTTGRSSQTRILQNLNKVVQCWVESRQREAAIRVTAILDLVDTVFLESNKSPADWTSLAETYSHAIRAWSFASSSKNGAIRQALVKASEDYKDPAQMSENLLLRLENIVDEVYENSLQAEIPLKIWRRIYGSVVSAYGREYDNKDEGVHNCAQARHMWDRFKSRGYGEPDIALYNHLFHVYGKMRDIEASENLWNEMTNERLVAPDLKSYSWRLLAYDKQAENCSQKNKYIAHAKKLWEEMREKGLSPDIVCYNTFLSCFIGTRDISIAKEGNSLFQELLSLSADGSCQASIVSLNTVLKMWVVMANHTEIDSSKEEALRTVLTILMGVHDLNRQGILTIRPNSMTTKLVKSLMKNNEVAEEKQNGALRLIENIARQSRSQQIR